MKINRNLSALLGVLAIIAVPATLFAATNNFVVPVFRGAANSQSGYWETFTVPDGAPGNLPDQPGATTAAVLTQTNPNGFLTDNGNIYNYIDADAFVLSNTTPFMLGTVVLQTHSVGAEINYGSMVLNYTDGNGSHTLAPLFRYELDRSAAGVSSLWQWDLTGLGVSTYNVTLVAGAAKPTLNFDIVPTGNAGEYQVFFRNAAVAGAKVTAHLPTGKDQALVANEKGIVHFSAVPDFVFYDWKNYFSRSRSGKIILRFYLF